MFGALFSFGVRQSVLVGMMGVSYLYPAYQTLQLMRSDTVDKDESNQWTTYWFVRLSIALLEGFFLGPFVPLLQTSRVARLMGTLFAFARFLFNAWMVLPQTKGALFLYETVLSDLFQSAERLPAWAGDRLDPLLARYLPQLASKSGRKGFTGPQPSLRVGEQQGVAEGPASAGGANIAAAGAGSGATGEVLRAKERVEEAFRHLKDATTIAGGEGAAAHAASGPLAGPAEKFSFPAPGEPAGARAAIAGNDDAFLPQVRIIED